MPTLNLQVQPWYIKLFEKQQILKALYPRLPTKLTQMSTEIIFFQKKKKVINFNSGKDSNMK